MKQFDIPDINTPEYWDKNQTATDFGLRQKKYLELAGKGDSIIELGCGLSPTLYEADFKTKVGVDFSKETIKTITKLYPDIDYKCANAVKTGIDREFDVVLAGEVIEHLEKPDELLKEMERLCKVGGIMIISTPHLDFNDPEHLWEFIAEDFVDWESETIHSNRFKGRSYLYIWRKKLS